MTFDHSQIYLNWKAVSRDAQQQLFDIIPVPVGAFKGQINVNEQCGNAPNEPGLQSANFWIEIANPHEGVKPIDPVHRFQVNLSSVGIIELKNPVAF